MIAIIDYQMGNLRSVQKGFERVGHQATITSDPAVLAAADKVVLPGVGAFGDAMAELNRRGLIDPIRRAVADGKPFLGICLGLQLLFDVGHEGGRHEGLGILRGEVVRFDVPANIKSRTWVGISSRYATGHPCSRGSTPACIATSSTPTTWFRATRRSLPRKPAILPLFAR